MYIYIISMEGVNTYHKVGCEHVGRNVGTHHYVECGGFILGPNSSPETRKYTYLLHKHEATIWYMYIEKCRGAMPII